MVVDLIFGVDYDTLVDSADNALKGILIPVAIASLVAALICTRWGWWGPVMREQRILPRWTLIVPALMAIAVIGGLIGADWDRDTDLVLIVVIGTLFVGFGEEIASRGLLLVGARGERSEVQVWLITSVLFGLLHGLNIILGQAVDLTIKQIIFAFLFGSALYVVRRSTGLLVVGMLLHGLWDMSTFLNTSPVEAIDRSRRRQLPGDLQLDRADRDRRRPGQGVRQEGPGERPRGDARPGVVGDPAPARVRRSRESRNR